MIVRTNEDKKSFFCLIWLVWRPSSVMCCTVSHWLLMIYLPTATLVDLEHVFCQYITKYNAEISSHYILYTIHLWCCSRKIRMRGLVEVYCKAIRLLFRFPDGTTSASWLYPTCWALLRRLMLAVGRKTEYSLTLQHLHGDIVLI